MKQRENSEKFKITFLCNNGDNYKLQVIGVKNESKAKNTKEEDGDWRLSTLVGLVTKRAINKGNNKTIKSQVHLKCINI